MSKKPYAPILRALERRDENVAQSAWISAALFLEKCGHDQAADQLLAEVPIRVALHFRGSYPGGS